MHTGTVTGYMYWYCSIHIMVHDDPYSSPKCAIHKMYFSTCIQDWDFSEKSYDFIIELITRYLLYRYIAWYNIQLEIHVHDA